MKLVTEQYGPEYLPDAPRVYQTKVRNAQEAHEAIRPAGSPFDFPEQLRDKLSADEFKLYDLIWKRTVASQMVDARGHRVTVTIDGGGATFQASGRTIDFPGYLRAYVEGSDDPAADLAERDAVLPAMQLEESLGCRGAGIKEPYHAATGPLHRSDAHSFAGRNGNRPAEHVRLDHRHDPGPRICLQARHGVGAHLDGDGRFATARIASAGAGRLSIHRPDGRRSGRDQPGRSEACGISAPLLFRQRQGGAEATPGEQSRGDRRPRGEPHPDRGTAGARADFRPRRAVWPIPRTRNAASQLARWPVPR